MKKKESKNSTTSESPPSKQRVGLMKDYIRRGRMGVVDSLGMDPYVTTSIVKAEELAKRGEYSPAYYQLLETYNQTKSWTENLGNSPQRYYDSASKYLSSIGKRAKRIADQLERSEEGYISDSQNKESLIENLNKLYRGCEERRNKLPKSSSGLEKAMATLAIMGGVGGLFFLSANLTGNTISNLSISTTSFLGAGFFIIGLIATFFWFKAKNKTF